MSSLITCRQRASGKTIPCSTVHSHPLGHLFRHRHHIHQDQHNSTRHAYQQQLQFSFQHHNIFQSVTQLHWGSIRILPQSMLMGTSMLRKCCQQRRQGIGTGQSPWKSSHCKNTVVKSLDQSIDSQGSPEKSLALCLL